MAWGEIISTVFAFAVMIVAAIALIEWMSRIGREWLRFLSEDAADRAPDYKGPCRCTACRIRPQEPCSEPDGV